MGGFGGVRALAGEQNGVVSLEQMIARSVSRRQVERAVERGELVRLHRGIYRLGPVASPYCLEQAAGLAMGPDSAVSHRSAPFLYGMLPRLGGPVHVTVSGAHRRGDDGILVHRSPLKTHEIRERHGIPVTSPVRTLVDLAADCTDQELEQAVAEAFALRLTTLPSLQRAVTAYRGRRGAGRREGRALGGRLSLAQGGPRG